MQYLRTIHAHLKPYKRKYVKVVQVGFRHLTVLFGCIVTSAAIQYSQRVINPCHTCAGRL